jgi:hypothetical protein
MSILGVRSIIELYPWEIDMMWEPSEPDCLRNNNASGGWRA